MFRTVSLVLTGCKKVDECYNASLEITAIVHELCYEVKLSKGSVKNMVGCSDCRFDINLYSLTENIGLNASFEPQLFPGLISQLINVK
jgi:transcription initiation factor TFIID TATA-box-binding protein